MPNLESLIRLDNISKSFKKDEQQDLLVLKDINLTLHQGEIIALLGKSGSGKSTLLRIIAGLVAPSHGTVFYREQAVNGPVQGISMVFQDFALLPWLTVLQNVELGLEAQGIPSAERRKKALQAIDTIGLDGFESAYPKELSGGMRQRIGFARALVVNPDILLMDEPFSALDVLTAEHLKSDLIDLWSSRKTNTNGIVFVTHNIEEAVWLADRIIVVGSDPGRIQAEITVDIPQPRDEQPEKFRALVDEIYSAMTSGSEVKGKTRLWKQAAIANINYRLPDVEVSELIGLLENIESPEQQKSALPELAESLHLDVDDLFSITEVLELLGFATVSDGGIQLTEAGRTFVNADILLRKTLFASHLRRHISLAQQIRLYLDEHQNHRVHEDYFLQELAVHFSPDEAKRVLTIVIEWARYAELFAYDSNTGMLSLENPK